jgi:hypothetical protein
LNEIGYFDIKIQNQDAFRIKENRELQIASLAGTGERIVTANVFGILNADLLLSDLSIWQENGNNAYYNNGYVGIGTNQPSQKLDIDGNLKIRKSDLILGTDDDRDQGIKIKNRALVHGNDDKLIINYAGDFEGGVLLDSDTKIGENTLIFKDSNHGITYKYSYASETIDGPVTYGWSGGALGTMQSGTEKVILNWKQNGDIKIPKLAGTGDRPVIANNEGVLQIADTDMEFDNLGNHTATKNLDMQDNNIIFSGEEFNIKQSVLYAPEIKLFSTNNPDANRRGEILLISNGPNGDIGFTNYDGVDWNRAMTIKPDGHVGIGSNSQALTPFYELVVSGTAHFCRAIAQYDGWCDYVFEPDYNLMSLQELSEYISQNKHLPEIPTEQEVQETDIDLGQMSKLLLLKVEELTIYIIKQQEQIDAQQKEILKIQKLKN